MDKRLSLRDYIINENWHQEMTKSIEQAAIAIDDITNSIAHLDPDSAEYAITRIHYLIISLHADLKTFSCFPDYFKDAYDALDSVAYYCPLTYEEIKVNDDNKLKLENYYNEMVENIDIFDAETACFEEQFDEFMQVFNSSDDEIPDDMVNNLFIKNEEIYLLKDKIYKLCNDIMEDAEEIKIEIQKKLQASSLDGSKENDGNQDEIYLS